MDIEETEMVTIRLPKKLCRAFADIANVAECEENHDAAHVVYCLLDIAERNGDLQLDSSLLDFYKPYDVETEQGGIDDYTVTRFQNALWELE